MKLKWDESGTRTFEAGLNKGVLYTRIANGISNSLITVATGSRTFPLDRSIYPTFRVGSTVKITDDINGAATLTGVVTLSSMNSVTVNVTSVTGSGAIDTQWVITQIDGAVAWSGLTGVDENGGDAAKVYLVEGRPFLFLPQAKEFSGTIKAITFPDEFSALQGVVEATDGMYLDSQQADAFGLCYRTLIGNDTEGLDYGYKIHLIYNATVTPQSISRATLSSEINPQEFSWAIQAVPIAVDGYRPTAHIILDSRHIDPDKLSEIEDLLYGSATDYAQLPDPQVVYDMLTYGDTITIVDNGDGTWEALGSYQNIYLIGDGIFQIDNVNATDLGDGTYNISSTP